MRTLTIRDLPQDVAEALERERRRRGDSINQTVIELLSRALGVGVTRSNGLARLAGRWSDEEFERFECAMTPFEKIDEELRG